MLEKAYVLEGSATLTADDETAHGPPVTINTKDMVTFPKVHFGAALTLQWCPACEPRYILA